MNYSLVRPHAFWGKVTPEPGPKPLPTTFGSARFLGKYEMQFFRIHEQGRGKTAAPYLGLLSNKTDDPCPAHIYARSPACRDPESPVMQELQESNGHILTVAPTRAGKGVGQIIPNLLSWGGSVLVLDIKGENYYLSAGCREKIMGQKIFRFAPFEKESEIWNPIMSIRANLNWADSTFEERCHEEEDARYLTTLLINESGSSDHTFWENSASNFLVGLLLHVRTAELPVNAEESGQEHRVCERSMHEVMRLLALDQDNFSSLLEDMSESKRKLIHYAGNSLKQRLSGDGEMGQSFLAVIEEQLSVWSYERVHKVTYKAAEGPDEREPAPNDFNFSQLREGNISIYLIIPPEYLTEYRSVLRVMIGFAIRELKVTHTKAKKHNEYQDKPPVLFILDEFPQLAYLRPIENALSYLAGFGVRFWFFVQDLSQLKLHYQTSWQSFLANTDVKCFFGVNDIETAEEVSKMIGITTVENYSHSQGLSESYFSMQSSSTTTLASFPLMTPDEVMRMKKNDQIIFIRGLDPIYGKLIKYYEHPNPLKYSQISPPQDIDFR